MAIANEITRITSLRTSIASKLNDLGITGSIVSYYVSPKSTASNISVFPNPGYGNPSFIPAAGVDTKWYVDPSTPTFDDGDFEYYYHVVDFVSLSFSGWVGRSVLSSSNGNWVFAGGRNKTLQNCYDSLSSVTALNAMSYTPTTTSQVIASGQYINGAQTINAIPSSYIVPNGTKNITTNSSRHIVSSYYYVSVNVQPALQSKTVTPTTAIQIVTPDANYYGLSKVTVNAIPSSYIVPSGTITISYNGTFDVGQYASASVTVPGEVLPSAEGVSF